MKTNDGNFMPLLQTLWSKTKIVEELSINWEMQLKVIKKAMIGATTSKSRFKQGLRS